MCFDGRASFVVDSTDIGEACVQVQCDASGRILCWCLEPPILLQLAGLGEEQIRCEGALVDGRAFRCMRMRLVGWPSEGMPSNAVALDVSGFVIGREELAQEWTFHLTNLLLQNFSSGGEPGRVVLKNHSIAATLSPDADYTVRMNYLRAYKNHDVTATLTLSAGSAGTNLTEVAGDVCLILSALTGHRVNWIVRLAGDAVEFGNRITKPCSGWPVLGRLDEALGRDWNWQDLLNAAGEALAPFERHAGEYRLRSGLVDSWIDARIETDFLESRGLKTVAVLEMIKTDYREHHNSGGKFSELLCCVYNELAIPVPPDLGLLTDIRNSLVHEGRFLPAQRMGVVQQYELLTHHTDRIMLALVGHEV
jgi:hypothetical protein